MKALEGQDEHVIARLFFDVQELYIGHSCWLVAFEHRQTSRVFDLCGARIW